MQPTLRRIFTDNNFTFPQRTRSLFRFLKWQFINKALGRDLVFQFTGNSKLKLMKGFQSLSGNYYFGLSDPDAMPFVLHLLRPGDLFVDVGANGGAYTVLASAEKKANSLAIEAASDTIAGLQTNVELNKIQHLVETHNVAASDKDGTLPFTSTDHATNRVLYEDRPDIIQVKAQMLDTILNGRVPLLIKMDIEGHEYNALLGSDKTLAADGCKALVLEFSNAGEYYGYGNNATHELVTRYGFKPFTYNYKNKELIAFDPLTTEFEFNMIYIKDLEFVTGRLKTADRVTMGGQLI